MENENKTKKELGFKISIGVLIAISLVGSVWAVTNFIGGEWVCVAQKCDNYISGDKWVATYCRPQNNTLVCTVDLNGQEQEIPLESINTSLVRSCSSYSCSAEIYIKTERGGTKNEN